MSLTLTGLTQHVSLVYSMRGEQYETKNILSMGVQKIWLFTHFPKFRSL